MSTRWGTPQPAVLERHSPGSTIVLVLVLLLLVAGLVAGL